MSNNFTNSDIDDLLSSVKTENHQLPQWLNIVDNNTNETSEDNQTALNNVNINSVTSVDSATSDVFFNESVALSATSADNETSDVPVQNGGFLSATSSDINDIFIGQLGGNANLKVSASPDDINNLIDMLTSEKVNENFDTVTSITNTEVLETQLRELLAQAKEGQEGGAKKKSKAKKASKKSSKKASKKSKKASKKASKKGKTSKKGSRKYKNEEQVVEPTQAPAPAPAPEKKKRAPNPALLAFGALSKHVSEKLGISNGPKAKKVAGAANREMKEKHPELSAVEIAKKAEEHFNNNIERFRKLIEE